MLYQLSYLGAVSPEGPASAGVIEARLPAVQNSAPERRPRNPARAVRACPDPKIRLPSRPAVRLCRRAFVFLLIDGGRNGVDRR